jgi:hypothetical protein
VGAIFLRHGSTFIAMREQEYEAEDLLQALIAEHPEVLADDEAGDRSNWLLVKREIPVESWSLDHLFLDREGVPTLVEVKRSSNTQLRREVVAQMLDYAANAATHWTLDALRTWFETECEGREADPEEELRDVFGVSDGDAYWQQVKTNLEAERIRLVFVADVIPAELRSIVEFLNRQMSATEVFAIEVKQYVDSAGERQTIVPRVIGRTEASKAAKTGARRPSREWDRQSVLEEIEHSAGEGAAGIAQKLIEWAETSDGVDIDYGGGPDYGSAKCRLREGERVLLRPFSIYSNGFVVIRFVEMRNQSPFDDPEMRAKLRKTINEASPGGDLLREQVEWEPSFSLAALADEQARQRFVDAIEWAFGEAWRVQLGYARQ